MGQKSLYGVQSDFRVKPNSSWVVVRLGLCCGWVGVLTIIFRWCLVLGVVSHCCPYAVVASWITQGGIGMTKTAQKQNLEFRWRFHSIYGEIVEVPQHICVQTHIHVKPNSSSVVVRLGLFCGWVGVLTIIIRWWLVVGWVPLAVPMLVQSCGNYQNIPR